MAPTLSARAPSMLTIHSVRVAVRGGVVNSEAIAESPHAGLAHPPTSPRRLPPTSPSCRSWCGREFGSPAFSATAAATQRCMLQNSYVPPLRTSRCSSKRRRFASSRRSVLSASHVSTPAALKRTMRPFCCCTMSPPLGDEFLGAAKIVFGNHLSK